MLREYSTKTMSSRILGALNTGTVKLWNRNRGFGFIKPDDGSAELFVHASAFAETHGRRIDIGDRVSFRPGINAKTGRPAAVDCRLAS